MTSDHKEYINKIPTESGKSLYLDVETADVCFLIGDQSEAQTKIPAHKNLLAAASDVFKRMFYGPLKETDNVRIGGVNAAAFKEFLQFFYIENVKLTIDNITDVMDLGHKYNMAKCSELCVEFLKDTLTDDNICTGLSLATIYDQNELKDFCKRRIIANTSSVIQSASFLECDRSILEYILNINLFSCSEMDIFDACMSWVRAASKQDVLTKELVHSHLGHLFYAIRFASMKMKDVANLTSPYGFLFSFDEYKEIIQLIELPAFQPQFFAATKRELPWNKDTVVLCDRSILNRPNTFVKPIRKIEATAFSTNEPILLGSLICTSLADQRERRSPTARAKQLVEVTIVEISGADIDESDQDDDDDDLIPELMNNNSFVRNESFSIAPRRIEPATVQNTNAGENRVNNMQPVPVPASIPMPISIPQDSDTDDEEEDEQQENNNETNDNDDDYDLIYEKRISNLKVYLRSKSRTKIMLSKPVLIRPGFLYEIRIQQTPNKNFYNAKQLKTVVQQEPDVKIRFHPDSIHNIKKYGMIVGLEFNRI